MIGFVGRRTAIGLLQALLVTAVLFVLLPLASVSDPAQIAAGESATAAQVAVERHILGLDKPIPLQYFHWLTHAIEGNLGTSLIFRQSVMSAIANAAPVTLTITFVAALFALLVGVSGGIIAAWRTNGVVSSAISLMSAVGIATPNFFIGLILARLLAVQAGWFPAVGFPAVGFAQLAHEPLDSLRHAFLPGIALGIPAAAALARYTAAALRATLEHDYIRTAVGKGLAPPVVVLKHGLKNALIPIVTVFGLELRTLLGGSVAVEAVFALPGIGTLTVNSVVAGDYPVIEGVALFALLVVTLINILVDASYAFLNPRIRAR